MKNWCFLLLIVTLYPVFLQSQDTITVYQLEEVKIHKNYVQRYNTELARVRKIYPYALHAAELLEQFDSELSGIDSKRKQKKYGKQAHNVLKDDYTYLIRDLYTSEGVLLMKLIHRETGLTASEIIKKYRGKMRSEIYDQLGKIWSQDMDIKYDPTGKDWLTEQIILEIQDESVPFENNAKIVTKEEYKTNMKQYRADKKEYRKTQRTQKKAAASKP